VKTKCQICGIMVKPDPLQQIHVSISGGIHRYYWVCQLCADKFQKYILDLTHGSSTDSKDKR